jgi:hypothetical protein
VGGTVAIVGGNVVFTDGQLLGPKLHHREFGTSTACQPWRSGQRQPVASTPINTLLASIVVL